MFERWSKKTASKVTNSAVEGVKETLNDKIDQYGDIIKLGLVLGVVIFGGKHLTRKQKEDEFLDLMSPPLSVGYPQNGYNGYGGRYGQPIVINNYYQRERNYERSYEKRAQRYERRNSYVGYDGHAQVQQQKRRK